MTEGIEYKDGCILLCYKKCNDAIELNQIRQLKKELLEFKELFSNENEIYELDICNTYDISNINSRSVNPYHKYVKKMILKAIELKKYQCLKYLIKRIWCLDIGNEIIMAKALEMKDYRLVKIVAKNIIYSEKQYEEFIKMAEKFNDKKIYDVLLKGPKYTKRLYRVHFAIFV